MLSQLVVPRKSRLIFGALVIAGMAGWVACGKSPTAPVVVAKTNAVVPVDPVVATAVVGTTFSFPGGAGAFSPAVANQNLSLAFGGTATALTSAGTVTSPTGATLGTFTSTVSFGSCDFKITAVTGNPGVIVGQVVRIEPCTLDVKTQGAVAGSTEQSSTATLVFGTTTSVATPVQVAVGTDGTVTVNGTNVGKVPVGTTTGTTGAV